MMNHSTTIQCPNCGNSIDVNDLLKHQIESDLQKEFEEKVRLHQDQFSKKAEELAKAKTDFESEKERQSETFEKRLAEAKKESEQELKLKIKKQLEDEQKDRLELLEKELNEKSEKVRELGKMEAIIAKLERDKLEMKDILEAEAEKNLNEKLIIERERIVKVEKERSELREMELIKQIEDQKRLTEEMKRKQEQGSTQLYGEVQELAIEEYLAVQFPLDVIDEIKKGANGADCIQIVNTRDQHHCGTIYYESKRTKNFQPTWIEKFKNDIREKKSDIGVLVTEVLPHGMERMGMKDGVWICTYEEFKGLSIVLRQSLIQVAAAIQHQENKGDKMEMLYHFLTSNEFRLQVEGIVEGFTQMQTDLASEKRAMQKIWVQREKQLEKVIKNTISMYGSIKGIAGSAVQTVKALELDDEHLIENE